MIGDSLLYNHFMLVKNFAAVTTSVCVTQVEFILLIIICSN